VSARGQMGGWWHRTSRRIHTYLWGGERDPRIRYRFFVHKRIISTVKRVEPVSDRMSYIIVRGRWFHIIVLYIHATTVDTVDDVEDRLYEELKCVYNNFPKYQVNIMFEGFNAKIGWEDIFKLFHHCYSLMYNIHLY
jgi:hypothetical protein